MSSPRNPSPPRAAHLVAVASDSTPRWLMFVRGRLRLHSDTDGEVALRPKERAVVAALAFVHPHPIDADGVAHLVWDTDVPATARKSVHNHILRIRRVAPDLITTDGGRYHFGTGVHIDRITPDTADALHFADLPNSPEVSERRLVLRSLIAAEEENRLEAMVASGSTAEAIEELTQALQAEPYREQRWLLLAWANAARGSRREAMNVLTSARRHLADVGLEAGDRFHDLERRILDNDPALAVRAQSSDDVRSDRDMIVGVDHHLADIERALDAERQPAGMLITGEAGSGKTTLATAVSRSAASRGWATWWATCSPEPAVPLEPFAEVVTQLHDRDPVSFDELPGADEVRTLIPGIGRPTGRNRTSVDRTVLLDALIEILGSGRRRTLIVIEDLHWASPLTLQVLGRIVRDRPADSHITLVATSREAHPDHPISDEQIAPRFIVSPWSRNTVRDFVHRFSDRGAWSDDVATWVHRQTGGHALFVREVVVAVMAEHAHQPFGEFIPPASVPEAVFDAIDAQLRGLGRIARQAVEAAAIYGTSVERRDLIAVSRLVDAGLNEAIAAGVLLPGDANGVIRFRHQLFHQAVLARLSPGRSTELHDLAAQTIETAGEHRRRHAEFARHALGAASLDPERAITALVDSARALDERFAWEEAIENYTSALTLIDTTAGRDARWAELAVETGRTRMRAGDAGSVPLLLDACEVAFGLGDQHLIADAVVQLCRLGPTSTSGTIDQAAARSVEHALRVISDPVPRTMVLGAGAMLYSVSDSRRCNALFEEAIVLLDEGSDADLVVDILSVAIVAIGGPRHLDRCEEIAGRLAAIAAETDAIEPRRSAAHLRLACQMQRGDPAMRTTFTTLREAAEAMRTPGRLLEYHSWASAIALVDGDLTLAEEHVDVLGSFVESIGESRVFAHIGACLLPIRLIDGRVGELDSALQGLVEQQPGIGAWHAGVAISAATVGDHERSRAALRRLLADDAALLVRDFTYTAGLYAAAAAASIIGDRAAARDAARLLQPWSGRWAYSGTGIVGPIDLQLGRLHAVLGDDEAALTHAAAALMQAHRLEAPLFVELCESVLAQLGG